MGIAEQVRRGIEHLRRRSGAERFIAYFQPGTNTHGPVDLLRRLYGEAIEHPAVVGLAVSTRPDCAGEDVLDVLSELAGRTYVSVEYGLQTIHEATLRRLNRGHDYAAFVDAVERTGRRGLDMCAHVILGLPGEDAEAMWATARELGRLRLAGVKLHNLHVVRGTVLADLYERGQVRLLDEDEYVAIVSRFLEYLDPRTAIHRLIADVPRDYLVAPAWCLDKERVRRRIEADLVARDTRQGARWHG